MLLLVIKIFTEEERSTHIKLSKSLLKLSFNWKFQDKLMGFLNTHSLASTCLLKKLGSSNSPAHNECPLLSKFEFKYYVPLKGNKTP
jgi:hypothetical protein